MKRNCFVPWQVTHDRVVTLARTFDCYILAIYRIAVASPAPVYFTRSLFCTQAVGCNHSPRILERLWLLRNAPQKNLHLLLVVISKPVLVCSLRKPICPNHRMKWKVSRPWAIPCVSVYFSHLVLKLTCRILPIRAHIFHLSLASKAHGRTKLLNSPCFTKLSTIYGRWRLSWSCLRLTSVCSTEPSTIHGRWKLSRKGWSRNVSYLAWTTTVGKPSIYFTEQPSYRWWSISYFVSWIRRRFAVDAQTPQQTVLVYNDDVFKYPAFIQYRSFGGKRR